MSQLNKLPPQPHHPQQDEQDKTTPGSEPSTTAQKANPGTLLIPYGVPFHTHLITSAHGTTLQTSTSHTLLDFTCGQMASILGHAHPSITSALTQSANSLTHLMSASISLPVLELASKLTSILPEGLDRAMFLSTGSESVEAAIRLAKVYTGKWEVVGLGSSWHGMTSGALSVQFHGGRVGVGPLVPGSLTLPAPNAYRSIFRHSDGSYDWETELAYGWAMIDKISCGSLAAVILEPILASGGMITLPRGYLPAMRRYCQERGMLLILDEAQTGLGRTGSMFAFETDGLDPKSEENGEERKGCVVPDILTLSKTLGGGIPLSAVVTSNEIATTCAERGVVFCTTHVNDPLPAAVGVAVLDTAVREDLATRARVGGERLHAGLQLLKSRYGCIGDVRGRGMFAGLEIVADRRAGKDTAPEVAERVVARMFELGLAVNLLRMGRERVIRLALPLVMSDEEIGLGLEIMEEAFRDTEGLVPLA